MPQAASTSGSSSSRPLRLRMRPDLVVTQQTYQNRNCHVVKDPLALKYHRFDVEEFALLELLDGRRSLDDVRREFERRFAPQQISLDELHQFVGMLHRASLLVSDASGQGRELEQRNAANRNRRRLAALSSVLMMRLPGFDPDALLTWLDGRIGWLFSRSAVALVGLLSLVAMLLLGSEFDTVVARLPTFQDFFGAGNWFWLALVVVVLKVLHEFGHGLACKRFGGECHEMGVMLLVFLPCLYCNVSDSWMLRNKWHRAAIGAAGIYVELLIAALATLLWWFTAPGLVNALALNVMVVSSLSTLLVNGNPLMRYDGYYILSDVLEIPNLRQKAAATTRRMLGGLLLGLPAAYDPFLPSKRRLTFTAYAVCSAVYRWAVTLAIFWFLYHVLEPYGLKIVGQIAVVFAIAALVGSPIVALSRFLSTPGRIRQVKKVRLLACAAAAAMLAAAVMMIPLPHYVVCPLSVQPRDAASVYVDVPGVVREVRARPGDTVQAGQPLLVLENLDVEIDVERLVGHRRQLMSQLASLQQRIFEEEAAGLEMARVEEEIATVEEQLQRRRRDQQRLTIVAPVSGHVVSPPEIEPKSREPGRLRAWVGVPLDEENQGATLADGVLVCRVTQPRQVKAVLAVDQGDVEFVRPGQQVTVLLDQQPGRRFQTEIDHVAQIEMQHAPKGLSSNAGGELLTTVDADGVERPLNVTYEASAAFDVPAAVVAVGGAGAAKVHVGYQTVGFRLWRAFCQTFEFEL
ncbi:MAG: HlyD family efflux transporter periplasmic adaptor subunit [Pirellulaceae bacterium]